MKILKTLNDSCLKGKKLAITFGNFDGVHLGHQDLIKTTLKESKDLNLDLIVVTFVPHPFLILSPKNNFLINSYEDRRNLLEQLGVEFLYEVDFNRDISTMKPETFFNQYIFNGADIKNIFIGYDFAFGANKSGDSKFVEKYCLDRGIGFKVQNEFKMNSLTISSTVVRNSINSGNVDNVKKYLGREHFLNGRVVKGAGRGRKIGFPTANLDYSIDRIIPKNGVYITKCKYMDMSFQSVTNIGLNPTFGGVDKPMVETHLLDFDSDIYGEQISVSFLKRLRDETKFDSVNDLVEQIKKDVIQTRDFYESD